MPLNLKEPRVIDWLDQFSVEDQIAAQQLLSNILMISADDLIRGLRSTICGIADERPGPVALYSERHIRHSNGKPNRLFKESRTKQRRAYGNGPVPVPQGKPYARETGSEGLIATLITGIVRADPHRFLDHPGPDAIRKHKVRSYVVVTDFIGSGRRACANLEAAWQIGSFKSWFSLGQLRFSVVAFSGTVGGVGKVERHPSRPKVKLHLGCPVVQDIEPYAQQKIIELCCRYAPRNIPDDRTPIGYGNAGALIVFDHGIPNNAPLLLHTVWTGWVPLFPRRSSALLSLRHGNGMRRKAIDQSLLNLRQARLARAPRFDGIEEHEQETMLLLVALKRRPRMSLAISARTGLPIVEVEALIKSAKANGYIDDNLRPTEAAYKAMAYLKTPEIPPPPLPKIHNQYYCPVQLRPPR